MKKTLIALKRLRRSAAAIGGVVATWILASNVWDDSGEWIDSETWND